MIQNSELRNEKLLDKKTKENGTESTAPNNPSLLGMHSIIYYEMLKCASPERTGNASPCRRSINGYGIYNYHTAIMSRQPSSWAIWDERGDVQCSPWYSVKSTFIRASIDKLRDLEPALDIHGQLDSCICRRCRDDVHKLSA